MILPDVNVLIYASRPDSADPRAYRGWLRSSRESPRTPRIFAKPSPIEEALAFGRVLLQQPTCTVVQPGDRHWGIFTELCRSAAATGNLIQDAWFAALAIESGCQWVTTDGDYARFAGPRWRRPF